MMAIVDQHDSVISSQLIPSLTNPEVRVYRSLDELRQLRPAWDRLLSRYPVATTFSTWEWLSAWWSNFGSARQMWVLAFFDPEPKSDALIGLAPLSLSKEPAGWSSFRVVRLMGDGSGDSDNLDIPVVPGYELRVARALAKFLLDSRCEWDIALFDTMPPDSLVAVRLKDILASRPWTCFCHSTPGSLVLLPETWEEYEQCISSEDRKNLQRYRKRLQERYSMQVYRCADRDELPGVLDALFRLHQSRWNDAGQLGSFSDKRRREFYAELSAMLLTRDWLDLWVLKLNDEIAAVQFAFRFRDRVFHLQEGYDPTRSTDRPGYILRGEILKRLITEKFRVYDFLGGEDPYKLRWGAQPRQYLQIHFALKNRVPALWLTMRNTFGKGKNWLRTTLPRSTWKALHKVNIALQRTRP